MIKTLDELQKSLQKNIFGYEDPKTGVIFIDQMEKSCGTIKEIKRVIPLWGSSLYYFGPDPRMDFAYTESFIKELQYGENELQDYPT